MRIGHQVAAEGCFHRKEVGRRSVAAPIAAPVASGRGRALVAGLALVLILRLLARMRRDLWERGELRSSTAAWMWTGYAVFAVLIVAALAAGRTRAVLPPWVRAAATALAVMGGVVDVAAMRRFAGPGQLTGTAAGELVTGGVYRYSRHPQYTGVLATLTGLTVLRSSPATAVLTVGLGATYRAWVPIEEEHLARHFGEPYRRYRNRTPRWVGRPSSTRPRQRGARRTGST